MEKVKVITEDWPNDNQILLDEITCKYIQNPDCTEDREGDPQEIILSSRDGGGGKFIHIKTNGWSISGNNNFEQDLLPLLTDFKKRMNEVFSNS